MEETYFPDDIWGEIKSFLLPPPLPKYPHPHSLLIKSLSTIYTIDSPKENVLYGYCGQPGGAENLEIGKGACRVKSILRQSLRQSERHRHSRGTQGDPAARVQ